MRRGEVGIVSVRWSSITFWRQVVISAMWRRTLWRRSGRSWRRNWRLGSRRSRRFRSAWRWWLGSTWRYRWLWLTSHCRWRRLGSSRAGGFRTRWFCSSASWLQCWCIKWANAKWIFWLQFINNNNCLSICGLYSITACKCMCMPRVCTT